jgi:MYXO-CTERM domain-containing protein
VECVPTVNEFGQIDTRCGNAAGDDRGTESVQVCTGSDPRTATWGAATVCGGGVDCQDPSTDIPLPTNGGKYCHGGDDFDGRPVTESEQNANDGTCQNTFFGNDYGPPISCPDINGNPVNDCCSDWCGSDRQPYSAYCGDPPTGDLPVWETDTGCKTAPGAPNPWAVPVLLLLGGALIRRRRST